MKTIFALSVLLATTSVLAQSRPSKTQQKVIYGNDDRLDIYEVKDSALVELARSTAAMIDKTYFKTVGGGGWSGGKGEKVITATTLVQNGMCKTERFANQMTAANCSGFLVDENKLVTAGHCIKDMNDCANYKWVFDFKADSAGAMTKLAVDENNVYSCKSIISRSLDNGSMNDFAILELDRNVSGRRPLTFRKSGKIAPATPVFVIGHPTGLPTKVAGGAKVRKLETNYFITDLDTYGGNSGSAVFNATTHEVEGILVRGDTDYVAGPNGCKISKINAQDAGRGEDVTYITNIKELKNL
jgi:V8-like Glu-specific endopeptidase